MSLIKYKIKNLIRNKIAANIPLHWRTGFGYQSKSRFLSRAYEWDYSKVRAWQFNKLKRILIYAYKNVNGYHQLFNEAKVNPYNMRSLEEFTLYPFTTKNLIRDNLKEFTTNSRSKFRMDYVTTSGSTGIPFGFFQNKFSDQTEMAFMHLGWQSIGWKSGKSSAILRGGFTGNIRNLYQYDAYRRELYLSSYYLTRDNIMEYIVILNKYKPECLQAYPSVIELFSNYVIEKKLIGKINFSIILLGSERILPSQIKSIEMAFPKAVIFGWYGQTEQVILAKWSKDKKFYNICPFYGFTEALPLQNNNKIYELVGTSFWNISTPFIRYKTDDIVSGYEEHFNSTSDNNCFYQRLTSIEGRIKNQLISFDGRKVPIPTTSIHDDTLVEIKQFQFFQNEPGIIIFKYIPKNLSINIDTNKINQVFLDKMGSGFLIKFEIIKAFKTLPNGKFSFVDQKIKF